MDFNILKSISALDSLNLNVVLIPVFVGNRKSCLNIVGSVAWKIRGP